MNDFSKATGRPWSFEEIAPYDDGLGYVRGKDGNDILSAGEPTLSADENRANAALIVAAVNAFDPEREKKVEALVEALTGYEQEYSNPIPDHSLRSFFRTQVFSALQSLKGGENG